MKNLISVSNPVKESEYGKILFSDVLVTNKRNLFMGRKWRTHDIRMVLWFLFIHLLALLAPFTFTWGAFWAATFTYTLFGSCGLSVSYHRNLAHRSFKLPKWLEYTFAYIGLLSIQRDPIFWVSMHRYHHQYVDSEKDPHSPIFGFWFSHMSWLFDNGYIFEKGVAGTLGYHGTFLVNSVCHIWGSHVWNTGDLSKNNWWVALLSFGEGWHNNHHAFEYSARHGLEWWQIDVGWYIIRFLEVVGLATNVKLPSKDHKLKMSFASLNKFE
ncbi:palmitoyl-monogalactosyldiacylglycerol delta-7 desaturase, chloroplastic isoform X3 [Helianthus annuus]|uniref:palmitoyl-monogalactosyldiacylglycerol delta-7 desaturase, chloroplastic isoform X3 n=1 Tax=Helianthus annuus TaxID=4232 RepID=UPI000B8F3671|nr:palmitoyl-monogalactosyldiacylglycerol delta-7 desaturase, chloroplastic isoform X3 [Helianthus annuus]